MANTRQVGVKISWGDELLIGPGVLVDDTDSVDWGEAKTKRKRWETILKHIWNSFYWKLPILFCRLFVRS
jgi:hypothetical protein